MRGFLGRNGKIYSDSQRKAIFANMFSDKSVHIKHYENSGHKNVHDKDLNRFVLPAVPIAIGAAGIGESLVGAGVASTGIASAGGGIGASLAAGGVEAAGLAGTAGTAGALGSVLESGGKKSQTDDRAQRQKRIEEEVNMRADAEKARRQRELDEAALMEVVSSGAGEVLNLGGPSIPSNSEWLVIPEESTAFWSSSCVKGVRDSTFLGNVTTDSDRNYMNVNTIRELVKKQYPYGDVDTKVKFLDPGKYTQFALRENPGREREAVTSNGFYSPVRDTAYLEKDSNKLNTLRAAIHELVHDMSDDGVDDDDSHNKYMLNEGYADYVAKMIMMQEIGLPEDTVKKTIGYPKEVSQVEKLVALNGRKQVDEAFLVRHSLDGLRLS